MSYYTKKSFWLGTAERAIKTFAQSLLSVLVVGNAIWGQDWAAFLGIAGTAALVSVLTSISDPSRADLDTTVVLPKTEADTVTSDQVNV